MKKEPVYKIYYRQQTPLKKIQLRWNWSWNGAFIGNIHLFFKRIKYGQSYGKEIEMD